MNRMEYGKYIIVSEEQKSNLKTFNSETEACEYFYTSLIEMLKGMGVI